MLVKSPMKKKGVKQNRRKNTRNNDAKKKQSTRQKGASHGRRVKDKNRKRMVNFPDIAPWKLILGIVVAGLFAFMYVYHVLATQKLLGEVQQMERQYNQAQRAHDSYRLMYDRMIGPAEISAKAQQLGFINGGPAEKIIEVEPE